jgi:hydroxymethylbilane synthase
VAGRLDELGVKVALVPVTTRGDQKQRESVAAIGTQGVFTKEIQQALWEDRIDLAVHSLKDLPTSPVAGLCLAAVPERAPAGDVLVGREHARLDDLPQGAVVGTGSLRRRAQILHLRPDLRMADIRGNVDTRLRKLDQGDYDVVVLAEAGLRRLGLAVRITQKLPLALVLPAVGQGALGLETRSEDRRTREIIDRLDHPPTHAAVLAERAMLAALEGGCLAPIAAWGRVTGDELTLTGRVLLPDGSRKIEAELSGDPADPTELGRQVAEGLRAQGADAMVRAARQAP